MAELNLWWQGGIIYQIYPRSFGDSNQDGIGDLNGITAHLDHVEELGVDAIWLSPIYPSPDTDFGYDVSDYIGIDPKFGTLKDFDNLVKEAHQRGIRIVLDLVLNHTSDQHPWFLESRKSLDNPYRDWYMWKDPRPNGAHPNNWQSVFGGPGWEYDPATRQEYFHMFYKEQPDLNWRNPQTRKAILDVFRFWLKHGVDGFRLDVFNAYFKSADLKDNPPKIGLRGFDRQEHIHDIDQPEMMPLLQEIRQIVDEYPERYIVGETFLSTSEKAVGYCGKDKLHAAFHFDFLKCPWRPQRFLKAIREWEHAVGDDILPNYVLNNHDNPRSATRYGRGEDDERLKVAAALLLTMRGTIFMYYGEEIGMRDISVSRGQIKDPVGKRFWPFYIGRDGCRAPMQWNANRNAGFGDGESWLPVNPDYLQRNVSSQLEDPKSLLNFYKRMIHLRKETPALREGMWIPLTQEPQRLLAYLRQTQKQTVLVALNFGRRRVNLVLGHELADTSWKLLISNKREETPVLKGNMLPLLPEEACILIHEQ